MNRKITVSTNYGDIEIIDLKKVWVEGFFVHRLMYSDSRYKYNCIYWSNSLGDRKRFKYLKAKLLFNYSRGANCVQL